MKKYCEVCWLVIAPAETYVKVRIEGGRQRKMHCTCYRGFKSRHPDTQLKPKLVRGDE